MKRIYNKPVVQVMQLETISLMDVSAEEPEVLSFDPSASTSTQW